MALIHCCSVGKKMDAMRLKSIIKKRYYCFKWESAEICPSLRRSAEKAANLRRSAENRPHYLSAFRYLLMVSVEIRKVSYPAILWRIARKSPSNTTEERSRDNILRILAKNLKKSQEWSLLAAFSCLAVNRIGHYPLDASKQYCRRKHCYAVIEWKDAKAVVCYIGCKMCKERWYENVE
jgi:hypothetical protein